MKTVTSNSNIEPKPVTRTATANSNMLLIGDYDLTERTVRIPLEEDSDLEAFINRKEEDKTFPPLTPLAPDAVGKIRHTFTAVGQNIKNGWENDLYWVYLEDWNEMYYHLILIRKDRKANIPWSHKQAIKNHIVGRNNEAVELFPAEDTRMVDSANIYHLWCLKDQNARIPVGYHEGDELAKKAIALDIQNHLPPNNAAKQQTTQNEKAK